MVSLFVVFKHIISFIKISVLIKFTPLQIMSAFVCHFSPKNFPY
jgi:hypothetical protein